MQLKEHIAQKLYESDDFVWQIVNAMYPPSKPNVRLTQISSFYETLNKKQDKAYVVTNTVLEKLDLLKVRKRIGKHGILYDWTVFDKLKDCKRTFIFENFGLLRMMIAGDKLAFVHLTQETKIIKNDYVNFVCFFVNRYTGEQFDSSNRPDVAKLEEFIYKLLCFVYLSENEEVLVQAGSKYGTRKGGKVVNQLPVPVTVINSRWNVTVVRTEGFTVGAHFAIRWTGEGRKEAKMVFIEPFEKKGYVRRAGKESI